MSTTTGSVLDPESSAVDTAALIAEIQGDLNALALNLAQSQMRSWRHQRDGSTILGCLGCGQASVISASGVPHKDHCMVGNIVKLTARLGELRDHEHRQHLTRMLANYFAGTAGKVVPLEYPQAATAVTGECPHCGPVCYRGAAHNARAEDGVFFAAPQPERHIEYSPIAGRGISSLLDPTASATVERVSYEEAAERNRAGLAVRA